MKAKDYYQKYHDGILSMDEKTGNEAIADFMTDLIHETGAMMSARKATSPSAFVGVVKEIEQKYLSVLSMFEKNDGVRPLVNNGYMTMLIKVAPEARVMMNVDQERKTIRMGRYGRTVCQQT